VPAPRRVAACLAATFAALCAGSALGAALRLTLFVVGALGVRLAAAAVGPILLLAPWLDPVYTRSALHTLSDVRLDGFAVAGPVPARLIAAGQANAVTLAAGLLLAHLGLVRRWPAPVVAGIGVQAQVVVGILSARPSLAELEAGGFWFALGALFPSALGRGAALSDLPPAGSGQLVATALVVLALLVAYVPAVVAVAAIVHLARRRGWRRRGPAPPARAARGAPRGVAADPTVAFGAASVLVFALSSAAVVCAPSVGREPSPTLVLAAVATPSAATATVVADPPRPQPVRAESAAAPATGLLGRGWDRWFEEAAAPAAAPAPPPARPSHVEVQGGGYSYRLLVDGEPTTIRGMGLNTQYRHDADRPAHLDADMTALRALGVNTLVGWDPAEFDQTLLDEAAAHQLGVVLPFDLDPDADYTDPDYRARLTEQVMAWVEQYRAAPALRMWGLGNEVLHKVVHPAWVGPQDPAQARNARAFATWLVETTDAIHAADPDHPVTYREAEDAFTPWVAAALRERGGGARPWFVWGTNAYSHHLQEIVDEWPAQGMDVPLWVSEFAPGGLAVPDRPDGFRRMWGLVRSHPEYVLGGAVYAWTRNGPEGVDRNFGLTDDGVPVDGRSLDALNELFHEEP
jgi:hypothetical protein